MSRILVGATALFALTLTLFTAATVAAPAYADDAGCSSLTSALLSAADDDGTVSLATYLSPGVTTLECATTTIEVYQGVTLDVPAGDELEAKTIQLDSPYTAEDGAETPGGNLTVEGTVFLPPESDGAFLTDGTVEVATGGLFDAGGDATTYLDSVTTVAFGGEFTVWGTLYAAGGVIDNSGVLIGNDGLPGVQAPVLQPIQQEAASLITANPLLTVDEAETQALDSLVPGGAAAPTSVLDFLVDLVTDAGATEPSGGSSAAVPSPLNAVACVTTVGGAVASGCPATSTVPAGGYDIVAGDGAWTGVEGSGVRISNAGTTAVYSVSDQPSATLGNLDNSGGLAVLNGMSLTTDGTTTNTGTIALTPVIAGTDVASVTHGTLANTGSLTNTGTIDLSSAGELDNEGTLANDGTIDLGTGGVVSLDPSSTTTLDGALTGTGTVTQAAGATVSLGSNYTATSGVTLPSGLEPTGSSASGGSASTKTASPQPPVLAAVKGTLKPGKTVTVTLPKLAGTTFASVPNGASRTVTWYVNGKRVATGAKLKIKSAWRGKKLAYVVVYAWSRTTKFAYRTGKTIKATTTPPKGLASGVKEVVRWYASGKQVASGSKLKLKSSWKHKKLTYKVSWSLATGKSPAAVIAR